MRGWRIFPVLLVLLVVIGLPALAMTETGLEKDVKKAAGFDLGECVPTTDLTSIWEEGANLRIPKDEPRAVTVGRFVYLVGGTVGVENNEDERPLLDPSDELIRFDPRTERYEEMAPMPEALNHVAVVAYRGDIYALGGYGRRIDANTHRGFYRYDPETDSWSRMPDMPEPRGAPAAGVIGDRLIVAGGAVDSVALADVFAFDFRTRRWSRLADMQTRREHVGGAVLDGKLYVVGGRGPTTYASDTAERFDPNSGRWEQLAPMLVPAGGLDAVAAAGRLFAIAGGNDEAETVTNAVQEFNPATGKWRSVSGLHTARHGHGATVIDGRIWVFGGSACAYFNATDKVESVEVEKLTG